MSFLWLNLTTYAQGDKEAASNITVSPLMDRHKEGVSKSQCDFLSKVVVPLFEQWVSTFPAALPLLQNTICNLQQWESARSLSKDIMTASFNSKLKRLSLGRPE